MERKTILEIIIEDCVFPKEFNYFLTINQEGEGEKRRTEISQSTKNPKFVENKFFIEINNPAIGKSLHEPYSSIINFSAFVVLNNNSLNKSTNSNNNLSKNPESTDQAKLLGENSIKVSELLDKLINSKDQYIKHNLNLVRRNEKDIDVVGKINLLLKLTYFSEINKENIKNSLNIAKNDDIHDLPEIDNKIPFIWRMRILLRSAINIPFRNPSLNTIENLPSVYIEMGWTQYEKEDLNFNECIKSSYIERNRFPIWNQEFLYYPNQDKNLSNKNIDGFFNILIRDIDNENPIKKISFPLNYLRSFHPINADFEFLAEGQKEKSHLFITLILEEALDFKYSESLINALMVSLNFDVLPKNSNKIIIGLSNERINDNKIPFTQINCDNENEFLNTIQNIKDTNPLFFLSNTLNLPISKYNNEYNAIQNFVFPRSFLDKNLYFYLYIRDLKLLNNHAMPNVLVGRIEMVQDLLKFSLNSKKNDVVPLKFHWDPNSLSHGSVVNSRCIMEFSVRNVIDKSNENSLIKSPNNSNYGNSFYKIKKQKEEYLQSKLIDVNMESSGVQLNEKWDLLSRELTQKQELIKRILQDVDDKTQMINLKGNEITELRKEINSLKNENSNLKLKLGLEQQIQIDTTITEEIENMSNKDLKTKILKMGQVYRAERLRNEELEKSLRKAKQEISNAKNLNQQYNQLLKKHQEDSKNLGDLQANVQKIGMFRETINKQEEVIVKLEKLLKNSIEDVNKQKKDIFELERLKTENLKLQTDLKNYLIKNTIQDGTAANYNNHMNLDKYRNEISRLENLVKNLQEKLNNSKDNLNTSLNRKISKEDSETSKIELEIKYSQALEKINILENELAKITKQYAEEISRLKIKISQKEAYLSNKK